MVGLSESNEGRDKSTSMTGRMIGLPESNEGRVNVSFFAVLVTHAERSVTHRRRMLDQTLNSSQ